MSVVENALGVAHLVLRQDSAESGASGSVPEDLIGTPGYCDTSNEYDGRMGVRISSIFVILVGSLLGKYSSPLPRKFFQMLTFDQVLGSPSGLAAMRVLACPSGPSSSPSSLVPVSSLQPPSFM